MANNDSSITAFFGGDTSGLEKAVDRAQTVVGGFQSVLAKIGIGLSAGAVIGFFNSVLNRASEINDLAESLDISTDAFQAFTSAVELSGGRAQDAANLLRNLRNKTDELAAGNVEATRSFAQLGLTQKDLVGIPLEQALEKIAKAYVANKNEAGSYASLVDIIGTKSTKLMGVLNNLGVSGFDALENKMRSMGQIIEADTVKKLDDVGDRLAMLEAASKNAGASVLEMAVDSVKRFGFMHGALGAYVQLMLNIPIDAKKAADATVKATEQMTNAFKGHAGTVKDFIAFNEAEAKREIERLEMREDRHGKINALLELANQYMEEAATYGENTKEQLEFITKANAVVLEVDKERAKIAKEHIEVMDKIGELQFEQLDAAEKVKRLETERATIAANIKRMKEAGEDTARAELALAETSKKLDAERATAAEKHIAVMDKLGALQFDRLSTAQKIAQLEKEAEEITASIEKAKANGVDTSQMQVALMETENKLAAERNGIAKAITNQTYKTVDGVDLLINKQTGMVDEVYKTVDGVQLLNTKVDDQVLAWDKIVGRVKSAKDEMIKLQGIIAGIATAKNFGNEDTAVLREMMRRNEAAITRISMGLYGIGSTEGTRSVDRGEIARLQLENQNLKQEIDLRATISRINDTQGGDAARRAFPGDPRAFERFFALAEGQDVTQKLLQKDIGDIKTILRNTFGK